MLPKNKIWHELILKANIQIIETKIRVRFLVTMPEYNNGLETPM